MRYGGGEGGGGRRRRGERAYHFMDIKTSPQQVRMIDYPANMRRKPWTPCVGSLSLHRMIQFSSAWSGTKSQCRSGEPGLTNLIIASCTFSAPLSLVIREGGGTISSIQMWPSGSSSSAPTTSGWYGGLYRPVGAAHAMWAQQDNEDAQTFSLFITFYRRHFHKKTPQKKQDQSFICSLWSDKNNLKPFTWQCTSLLWAINTVA